MWRWGVLPAGAAGWGVALLASPGLAAPGCVVTFRHGEVVQADRCLDQGAAVAYVRFGGWVVVLKSSLASVADSTGVTRYFPPFTAAEERERHRSLPREGGAPVAPATVETVPPPPMPPVVESVPVPVPVPAPPLYQAPAAVRYYGVPVVICRHCRKPGPHRRPHASARPLRSRIFPFLAIGPQPARRTLPPIVVPPRRVW